MPVVLTVNALLDTAMGRRFLAPLNLEIDHGMHDSRPAPPKQLALNLPAAVHTICTALKP